MEPEKKRNQIIALTISITIHLFVVGLFLLIMAWRAPIPPHPKFGIEIGLGFGEQSASEKGQSKDQENLNDILKNENEEISNSAQTPASSDQEYKKIDNNSTIAEIPENQELIETYDGSTPEHEIKKTDKKTQENIPPQNDKGEINQKNKKSNSTGDSPDEKALYGRMGGGESGGESGGSGKNSINLMMSGWVWANQPDVPELPDNENGKIEFEIECDENGDITSIKTLQRGLSSKSEQLLKDEIRKNSLLRTSGGKPPNQSKGKVVFILKIK